MSDPRPVDPSRSDDEAAWEDLVRRFHESDPVTPPPASTPAGPDPAGPRDHVVEEPEEDFVPPEPAPLSTAEPALAAAWTGVGVSLGLLLVITVFARSTPSLLTWALAGLFLVSAGYLGYRLPRDRHDGDDGAQV
ncbi:hypothetical protein V6N00_10625 [Tersicoccus sp. MR15.9]|uniref:hypothetical protein n=1 Tax=Tersicoccus mangrovi TaxID=3121635 RepID=UPI002FE6973D